MNCNCIEENQKAMVGLKVRQGEIIKSELNNQGIIFDNGKAIAVTSSDFDVKIAGKKKSIIKQLIHNFCPFCGKKIDKSGSEASSETLTPSKDAPQN
jgi:phosphopentomutase